MVTIIDEVVAQLYQSGLSTTQVAKEVGSTSPTVLRSLRRSGVKTRSISEAKVLRSLGNKREDSGYITVSLGAGSRKKEHVIIAECVLGRPLKKGEEVHHINGVKTDNRRSNLLICTKSYHVWLHWKMKKQQDGNHNERHKSGTGCKVGTGISSTAEYQRRFG